MIPVYMIQYTALTQNNYLEEEFDHLAARDTTVKSASRKWISCQIYSQCADQTWYRLCPSILNKHVSLLGRDGINRVIE